MGLVVGLTVWDLKWARLSLEKEAEGNRYGAVEVRVCLRPTSTCPPKHIRSINAIGICPVRQKAKVLAYSTVSEHARSGRHTRQAETRDISIETRRIRKDAFHGNDSARIEVKSFVE